MNYKNQLLELIKKNDGIVLTKDVVALDIPRQYIYILVKEGVLEKISSGVYITENAMLDEMYILQAINERAIFSHETSLYMHDLTDRDPLEYTVTVPSGYNASKLKKSGVNVHFIKMELHDFGVIEHNTILGRTVKIYDVERTICDMFRKRKRAEAGILNEALRRYVRLPNKNIPKLLRYAKEFNIDTILRDYLEVLL